VPQMGRWLCGKSAEGGDVVQVPRMGRYGGEG
jgi:hypothetical protein